MTVTRFYPRTSLLYPEASQAEDAKTINSNRLSSSCVDIFHHIFSLARSDLSACASVSRRWKEMAYHPRLQQMIFPKIYCGSAEWMSRLNLTAPIKEPSIPLDFYSFFDEETWQLILVPDHFVTSQGVINTNDIASLKRFFTKLQVDGVFISGAPYVQTDFSERTRWVAYRITVIGKYQDFETQKNTVKTIVKGAQIPGLVDMLMICFREKLRTGKYPFQLEETRLCLRVDEKLCNETSHQSISFNKKIEFKCLQVSTPDDSVQRSSLAVVPILKTYGRGTCKNETSKEHQAQKILTFTFRSLLKGIQRSYH